MEQAQNCKWFGSADFDKAGKGLERKNWSGWILKAFGWHVKEFELSSLSRGVT